MRSKTCVHKVNAPTLTLHDRRRGEIESGKSPWFVVITCEGDHNTVSIFLELDEIPEFFDNVEGLKADIRDRV